MEIFCKVKVSFIQGPAYNMLSDLVQKLLFLFWNKSLSSSVADLGCLSRIPDPTFFHPGSRIRIVSIPDPGSTSKNICISIPKKWFLSSRKYDPGCSSRIRIPTFYPSRIPDPGVKKAPDPGSGSATLLSSSFCWECVLLMAIFKM